MFAVVSLMVGGVVMRLAPEDEMNAQIHVNDPNELGNLKSVQVAIAVTFTSGIVLVSDRTGFEKLLT
ncbi:unnamed protein product [Anisakis simplex]|uniref:MFS domain-containing protein n=1 Tax=Anisakis simplex TaxID=6269 RepID=A0A0M3J784_ANISI|nr:unnamed protein product [Anisakis simplex]